MLAVGPEVPAALQPLMRSIVDAITVLQQPGAPVPLPPVLFAKLPPAASYQNCAILVTDKQSVAVSTYSGSAWAWTRADGSAL